MLKKAGITRISLYPLIAAIHASPMPVFPAVASMRTLFDPTNKQKVSTHNLKLLKVGKLRDMKRLKNKFDKLIQNLKSLTYICYQKQI